MNILSSLVIHFDVNDRRYFNYLINHVFPTIESRKNKVIYLDEADHIILDEDDNNSYLK